MCPSHSNKYLFSRLAPQVFLTSPKASSRKINYIEYHSYWVMFCVVVSAWCSLKNYIWVIGPSLGQSQARPSQPFGFWPGL